MSENWEAYRKQRNFVTSLKRSALKSYCINVSTNTEHPGEFWKKFHCLLPSKEKGNTPVQLIEDGRLVTDSIGVANLLNDYFIHAVPTHVPNLQPEFFKTHSSVIAIEQELKGQTNFSFTPVQDSYIRRIITSIKLNKATGADGISPRLLKLAEPGILSSLTKFINRCIISSSWPSDWKISIVSPIYKKDSETLKSNYRPISVLPAVSKIAERVIFDQLYQFSLNFLSGNLSGFLKGHSCTTALLKTCGDIKENLDSSEHSAAIHIDLSKAFDSINHNLLLAKLSAYGLTEDALQLVQSYLTDRKQHVKIDGNLSDWQIVKCGVPQGSILGPLLFNIYVNDVNSSHISCSLRFYADDTTAYSSSPCPSILQTNLQSNLGLLVSWFHKTFLAINHSKSQSIVFHRTILPTPFDIDRNELDYVKQVKLLGVTMDNSQSFQAHIKEICRKVNAKVSILRRIRKLIPTDIMINLYKAFILPHFEYASPLFIGLSRGLSAKLESTNAFALRTLLN